MHSDDAGRFGIKGDVGQERVARIDSLNPLLRMAVLTGVESAVSLHISRGDNLNARDADGLTPLMLCSLRNRHRVCRQLLDAGSDPSLLSPEGKSAYQMAVDKGAKEVAAILVSHVPNSSPIEATHEESLNFEGKLPKAVVEERRPDYTVFPDLDAWEADEETAPPPEIPELAVEAARVHADISLHVPEDTESSDWTDIEAYLPETATPPLRLSDGDDAYLALRLVFLRALREGSVPLLSVEDVVRNLVHGDEGQILAHLKRLIGDLGADTDERFEYTSTQDDFSVYVAPDASEVEDDLLSEAFFHFDAVLSKRNEPIRQYLRTIQSHALLDAEQEILLGRQMEESFQEALELVAADACSIRHISESIKSVRAGRRSLASISRGWADLDESATVATEDLQEGLISPEGFDESYEESEDSGAELTPHVAGDDDKLLAIERVLTKCIESGPADKLNSSVIEHLKNFRLTVAFLSEIADQRESTSPDGEKDSLRKVLERYQRARERMITSNLKLVLSYARKYVYSGMPLEDLVQEGNIGLIKAVERYDWRKGFRFSTYATWWIRQQIGRSVADCGRTIRLPVHIHEKLQKLHWFIRNYEDSNGAPPPYDVIAAELSVPVHKVGQLLSYMQDVSSLDAVDGDWPVDPSQLDNYQRATPEEVLAARESHQRLHEMLSGLSRGHREIICLRFGINSRDAMTLEEVGQIKGVTRERIRQIEAKVLRTLKHPTRVEWLKGTPALVHEGGKLQSFDLRKERSGDEEQGSPREKPNRFTSSSEPERDAEHAQSAAQLEELLARAKSLGIEVKDQRCQNSGRLWVLINSLSDLSTYRLTKQLKALGFKEEDGKGYWK